MVEVSKSNDISCSYLSASTPPRIPSTIASRAVGGIDLIFDSSYYTLDSKYVFDSKDVLDNKYIFDSKEDLL